MATIKSACKNGDIVYHTFNVTNGGSALCTNASATLEIPEGVIVRYRSSATINGGITPTLTTGIYNPIDNIWQIGDLIAGQRESITIEVEITDETSFENDDFVICFDITSSCVESTEDNTAYLCIEKYCEVEDSNNCENVNITLK